MVGFKSQQIKTVSEQSLRTLNSRFSLILTDNAIEFLPPRWVKGFRAQKLAWRWQVDFTRKYEAISNLELVRLSTKPTD
ncbi:hypothetical protein O9992_01215 [Vibrio lentus]|nr:hypothetical protein [Vibrio lentus]